MRSNIRLSTLIVVVLLITSASVVYAESDNSDVSLTALASGGVKVTVEDPNGIAKIVLSSPATGIEKTFIPKNCPTSYSFVIPRNHYRKGKGHEHAVLVWDCQGHDNFNWDDGWEIPPGGLPQENQPQKSVITTGETSAVAPGNTTTVSFHLYNTQNETLSKASMQIEQLPAGWTIINQTSDGGTWNATNQSWTWTTVDDLRAPTLTISLPNNTATGSYEIIANSTDAAGHNDSFTVPVEVDTTPTVDEIQLNLTANTTNLTVDETVEFTTTRTDTGNRVNATVTVANQTLMTGSDGNTTYTFKGSGKFTATVNKTATTNETFLSDSINLSVTQPANTKPTVSDINWTPTNPVTADSITFNVTASDPDGDQLGYDWAFGDGSLGFGNSTTHSYASPGNYNVTVTVTDTDGASTTYAETITVGSVNSAPTVSDINWAPAITTTADTIQFSSNVSDPDGDQLSYEWAFGDGNTTNGSSVTHNYSTAGTYQVTLTVSDGNGGVTTYSENISISVNAAPTVSDVSWTPSLPTTADTVQFSSNVSDPDGDRVRYEWAFGDGNTTTGSSVTHNYSTAGTYQVTLTVSDTHGAVSNYSENITINEQTQSGLSLSVTGTTIDQGTTNATVSVTLENTGSQPVELPALSIGNLPSGWSVTAVEAPEGTPGTNQRQVIYNAINPQSQLTPRWTLTVPPTVAAGTYNVTANLTVGVVQTQSTTGTVTVAPAGVTVGLSPESSTARPGSTATVAVNLSDFNNGVGSYEFNATVNDTSVATISDVELIGASADDLGVNVGITSDGSMASVTVPEGSHNAGVIARITLTTSSPGTARITVSDVLIGDRNFSQYEIGRLKRSVLRVSGRTAPPPVVGTQQPSDPDGDGQFEDITGDGQTNILDVGAFLQNRRSKTVQNNIDAFDFTGDGAVNILDVGKLLQQVL